jgi:hypothetical protein
LLGRCTDVKISRGLVAAKIGVLLLEVVVKVAVRDNLDKFFITKLRGPSRFWKTEIPVGEVEKIVPRSSAHFGVFFLGKLLGPSSFQHWILTNY